jgi:tRNA (guanosine-2'-O-)-methyltransferase
MSQILPLEWLHQALFDCLTDHKKKLFESKSALRTHYIRWAVEDVEHEQNASALLRTADSLGYDEVFVFEDKYNFQVQPNIAKRADKWVQTHVLSRSNDLKDTLHQFKNQGVKIVATSPHKAAYNPENIPIDKPFVVFLGSEREGLSQDIIDVADYQLRIPMVGFSESMNVSVSAGILMYTLRKRLEKELVEGAWLHGKNERLKREIHWAQKTIPSADKMINRWEQEFLKTQ